MAYATTLPPARVTQSVGAAPALWLYASADVHTDVDATDYFTNGNALGMRVNDVVIVIKTTATIGATLHVVTASTAGGAATVSAAILA
jgi:lipid-binding SYLF domain-containing protein